VPVVVISNILYLKSEENDLRKHMNDQPTSKERFKRLGELCLRSGGSGFPKDFADQHILLKSAVLILGQPGTFSEKEVNEKLEYWVRHISQIKEIDRVTLRRRLVDTGYLVRSKDGSSYQIAQPGPKPGLFDATVDQLDVGKVIEATRAEIARRKKEYLEKAR
jgi:hypothetical protein